MNDNDKLLVRRLYKMALLPKQYSQAMANTKNYEFTFNTFSIWNVKILFDFCFSDYKGTGHFYIFLVIYVSSYNVCVLYLLFY